VQLKSALVDTGQQSAAGRPRPPSPAVVSTKSELPRRADSLALSQVVVLANHESRITQDQAQAGWQRDVPAAVSERSLLEMYHAGKGGGTEDGGVLEFPALRTRRSPLSLLLVHRGILPQTTILATGQ
jgi:hypothetical protein